MIELSIKTSLAVAPNFKIPAPNKPTLLLEHVLYIYYLIRFKKNQAESQALINYNNKINAMIPIYIKRLGVQI